MCGQAHVRIWNSISLNTLKVIGIGLFERAVCCLAFSKLVCIVVAAVVVAATAAESRERQILIDLQTKSALSTNC